MSRTNNDSIACPEGRAPSVLRRISEALGCSTESLLVDLIVVEGIDTPSELLQLWDELSDTQARLRILSQLRSEVERQRSGNGTVQ